MPKFQLHDTVVLRQSPTFVGLIERTSQIESEPLEDCLIVAHTDVPPALVDQFIATGTPPPGYVFVQFASQEKGSSLVAEDDLHLVDRMLELGDVVKGTNPAALGTVINLSTSYVLDPVWKPHYPASGGFSAVPTDRSRIQETSCNSQCRSLDPHIQHVRPSRLISNVPFEELKRAQDFMEGDYVMHQDWLGVVDEVELLVIIMLSDAAIVAVQDPEELLIPIPDHGKTIVYLPEFDGIARPPYVSSVPGHGHVIPPEDLEIGQYVVTNKRNVRHGRFLRGSWDPNVSPEGFVLLVRCCNIGVHWLICNAYTPTTHWRSSMPPRDVTPYENAYSFPDPTELRRNRSVTLYDPGKHSATIQDRTRIVRHGWQPLRSTGSLNVSSSFNIGDQVKFRDPAGAAVKYQPQTLHGERHAGFQRMPHSENVGYDFNEFEVVQSSQRAIVRWQDGTTSEHASISLNKVNLFETDLMPGDIVVSRDGMKQQQEPQNMLAVGAQPTPFNEMTYFETPHDLLPVKVGIVQQVLATDKLAQIRWYSDPKIRITRFGSALSTDSRFGPISDQIEDVSLYEVMSFPALIRKLRDIVMISPSTSSQIALDIFQTLQDEEAFDFGVQITALSQFPDKSPSSLLKWLQHVARRTSIGEPVAAIEPTKYKPHRSTDWVGEIGQILLDGTIVVRTNNQDAAQDVLLEHDQILAFVDANPIWMVDHSEDPMELDLSEDEDYSSEDVEEEILAEEVEYEGGQRIDQDSGDDNWESDDEADASQEVPVTIPQTQPTISPNSIAIPSTMTTAVPPLPDHGTATALFSHLSQTEPPGFACLDRTPPPDQFRVETAASVSPSFLKRIAKDHRMLAAGLPSREVYVRTYENRLDLLRCLIVGPEDTPYENAPFLIDLHLGPNYPKEPPTAHFHSWTSGMGRINPNLYEEGKICLSLLGTWPGKGETESWTPKATLLQLLVSIQGLVFVKEPFYNEAGFEGYESTKEYENESLTFSEKAYVMARNFVKHALSSPVPALEDVLAWLYLPKPMQADMTTSHDEGLLKRVIVRSRALMKASEDSRDSSQQQLDGGNGDQRLLSGDGSGTDATKVFLKPLSRGAFVMLNKSLQSLEEISVHSSPR